MGLVVTAKAVPALVVTAKAVPATHVVLLLPEAALTATNVVLLLRAAAMEGVAVVVADTQVLLQLNLVQTEAEAVVAVDRSYFNTSETILFSCFIFPTGSGGV